MKRMRNLVPVVALLLAGGLAHAGSSAVSDINITRIQVFAPVLFPSTGLSQSSASNRVASDADQIPAAGNTQAMVLDPLEEARASTTGAGGFGTGGAVRAATQADSRKNDTAADASERTFFSFISASSCTSVRVEVDYNMLQRLVTHAGERALADQSIGLSVGNVDLGISGVRDSFRIVNDLSNGMGVNDSPSGTLSVTVPCAGTDLIQVDVFSNVFVLTQAFSTSVGEAPSNPLLPDSVGPQNQMAFSVEIPSGGPGIDFPLYFDPPAVNGYSYSVVTGDPNFASVVVPEALPVTGDDQFRVLFGAFDLPLVAGNELFFTDLVAEGVSDFQIVDIDPNEGLDPADPLAFVTGITFLGSGPVTMEMTAIALCGNGVTDAGEECDDAGESGACDADCSFASCGDGTINVASLEECDDGNTDPGDGCHACLEEDGFLCSGTPSMCETVCGDALTAGDEECDDGASNSDTAPDACRSDCSAAGCGDLVIDSGEICDDGNVVSGDGCSPDCQDEDSDGDGVLDAMDECPDSIVTPTVIVDDCDSGVANHLLQGGCTTSDEIALCAVGASNHGRFVSCVDDLTGHLKKKKELNLITGREADAIQTCAAMADIP